MIGDIMKFTGESLGEAALLRFVLAAGTERLFGDRLFRGRGSARGVGHVQREVDDRDDVRDELVDVAERVGQVADVLLDERAPGVREVLFFEAGVVQVVDDAADLEGETGDRMLRRGQQRSELAQVLQLDEVDSPEDRAEVRDAPERVHRRREAVRHRRLEQEADAELCQRVRGEDLQLSVNCWY